jgi:hypothetical protein
MLANESKWILGVEIEEGVGERNGRIVGLIMASGEIS